MISLLYASTSSFEELEFLLSVFGVFIAIVIAVITLISKVKNKFTYTSSQSPFDEDDHNQKGFLTEEQRRYQNKLKQRKAQSQQSQKPTTMQSTIDFGGGDHSHTGEVETYDPIVGSLGAHSDEGCDELDGVRLVATDLMYDEDEGVAYDRKAILRAMVMGEVLNEPRFKKPFGKR